MTAEVRGLALIVERGMAALARRAHARPIVTLGLVAVVSTGAALSARNLEVDPDLVRLLPKSFASVTAIERLEKRFGSVGYVSVLGIGAEVDDLVRFADDARPLLEALPEIRYVDHKTPAKFFEDRAALYLTLPDLETIQERVDARLLFEKKKANPLFVDLDGEAPPPLDFSDIEARTRRRLGGIATSTSGAGAKHAYHLDPDRKTVVLLAKPGVRATDLKFAKSIISKVEAALAPLDPKAYGPDFRIALSGRYVKKVDLQRTIESDLSRVSWISLVLILLYLLFHFRRIAAIFILVGPLVVGLLWTFGFAAFAFESLNILTAFVGVILLGLGIDHGIHLLARYQEVRGEFPSSAAAIEEVFSKTGRSVAIAGGTTVIGFGGIAFSEFRAFSEFGVVAAIGIAFGVVAYVICLPALLGLAAKLSWSAPVKKSGPMDGYARVVTQWGPVFAWGLLVTIAFAVIAGRNVSFAYDFAKLDSVDSDGYRLDRVVNEVLGRSQTPIVVLTDTATQAEVAAQLMRERKAARGDTSGVDFVLTLPELIPDEQEAKLEILEDLAESVGSISQDSLPENGQRMVGMLRSAAAAGAFSLAELPAEIRRQFDPNGLGAAGGLALVFPRISLSDGRRVLALAEELRPLPVGDGKNASVAAEAMVLADVLRMVLNEGPTVILTTMVLVFIALVLLLGRLSTALLCYAPAVATAFCTFGVLALLGVELNYLNIVIIPVIFGIAVDEGVHLVVHGADAGDEFAHAVSSTGRAVVGATLTTGFGFGSLLVVRHPGLWSFGAVATIGLAVNFVASLGWLAGVLSTRHIRARHLAEHGIAGRLVDRLAADISTVWGAGYTKRGGGTVGALAALPLAWFLTSLPVLGRVAVVVALTAGCTYAAQHYLRTSGREGDPSEIVSDELVGVLIPLVLIPFEWPWVLAAFVLFRFFDIAKPGPVGWADRNLKGATGVMFDDVIAGVLAALVVVGAHAVL